LILFYFGTVSVYHFLSKKTKNGAYVAEDGEWLREFVVASMAESSWVMNT